MQLIRQLKHKVTTVYIQAQEKTFRNKLKYVLRKKRNSDVLLVVFSGFPGNGKAGYNYMRTLRNIPCNTLFILDDFGYEQRGSYYLGESGDFFVKELVLELITETMNDLAIKMLVTAGSSKGGTCALMFGLLKKADAIIAGAPQYYIGDYLATDDHHKIMEGICGSNLDAKDILNRIVPNLVLKYEGNTEVYLHYSPYEHTYPEHIQYLIDDLNQVGIAIYSDIKNYTAHQDVAYYFPHFLRSTISNILKKNYKSINMNTDKCL